MLHAESCARWPGAHLEDAPRSMFRRCPVSSRSCAMGLLPSLLVARVRPRRRRCAGVARRGRRHRAARPQDLEGWLRTRCRDESVRTTALAWRRANVSPPTRGPTAHASIGPSCASRITDGRLAVVHSQACSIGPCIAAALDLSPEAVVVQHVEGAGAYGHNAPTTLRWMPHCSLPGCPARTCGCSGAAPTNCRGTLVRPWSPSQRQRRRARHDHTGPTNCGATATCRARDTHRARTAGRCAPRRHPDAPPAVDHLRSRIRLAAQCDPYTTSQEST